MTAINERLGVRPWDETIGKTFEGPMQYFLDLRRRIRDCKSAFDAEKSGNRLWIDYEHVVLDTDNAAREIFEFLGIDGDDRVPATFFHPEISSRRIGKWKRLGPQDKDLIEEIEILGDSLGLPEGR